ncbi:hypothetical protein EBR96_09855, partial [bacterium]|nr:hypothetical protein [bacterium]
MGPAERLPLQGKSQATAASRPVGFSENAGRRDRAGFPVSLPGERGASAGKTGEKSPILESLPGERGASATLPAGVFRKPDRPARG